MRPISTLVGVVSLPGVARLIVAPHCDDETLGCGGLLAKHPEDSAVLVLAQPTDVRRKEFDAARRTLGYHEWFAFCAEFSDGYVGQDGAAVVAAIDRACLVMRPQEIYLPFPSVHQDHIAAYEAGMRAARLSMSDSHWYPPSVYVYDVPAYDVNLYPTDLRWNVFETLTAEQVEAKAEALRCYASQMPAGPHPANQVESAAAAIGAARLVPFAEHYALVRKVRP